MPARIARMFVGLIAAATAFPQAQAPAEFEVASVKPNLADDRIVTIRVGPGGMFTARGYTLVLLIQRVYGVMDWNVSGGPGWIRTDRFDVAAKANVSDLTEAKLQPMLAKLLADRFKLKLRRSSTQTAGYALEVTKGGAKLNPARDSDEHQDTFRFTNAGLSAQGLSMRNFARFFGGKLGVILADETGLTGLYDFKLDWKIDPDRHAADLPGADPREPLREAALDALHTQLGLRAVPKKVTIESLVIEHVEKPSAIEN